MRQLNEGQADHALPVPDTDTGGRILVVDDDHESIALVAFQLARAGFRVEGSHTATEAITSAIRSAPDVVVLNYKLPDGTGLDVLQALRASRPSRRTGVIMVTALRDDEARIRSLEMGADDCISRPFNVRELVARVAAVHRRVAYVSEAEHAGDVLRHGTLELNRAGREVFVNGQPVSLTHTEFELLNALMAQPRRALSRAFLLRAGMDAAEENFELGTRTVDMHLTRLRTKLGDAGRSIVTVRGAGYRFDPPGAASSVTHSLRIGE